MRKAKIEIETKVEGNVATEKYICQFDEDTIIYKDKQKTTTTITYFNDKMEVKREGFVNYCLTHDNGNKSSSQFKTLVEGQPFEMELLIQNKSYKVTKCGKILSIETQFVREDNELVTQLFKVEEK